MIAAWRSKEWLGAAVASALAQPETEDVAVVDDGSGDGGATLAIARAADDGTGRLICIALEKNGGAGRARNVGIDATRAPWIAILDHDDTFAPGRFTTMFREAGDYDLIADDILETPEGAPPSAGRQIIFRNGGEARDVSFEEYIRRNITRRGRQRQEYGWLKPLMSRALLERNGIRYDETVLLGEDYDIYARAIAAGGRFRLLPYAGYLAIQRNASVSSTSGPDHLACFLRIDENLMQLPGLTDADRDALRAHHLSTRRRLASMQFNKKARAGRFGEAAGVVLADPLTAPWIALGVYDTIRKKIRAARLDPAMRRQPA